MNKRPWHLWIVALFMIFIYSMGIYDIFMMLSHNAGYYASHGYGDDVLIYFTDYPIFPLAVWIINLACGLIAPVLLLLLNRLAAYFSLVSVLADILLLIYTFSFENRWNILGANIAMFDFFILLITVGLYIYCLYFNRAVKKAE